MPNQPPLNQDALDKAALAMCHYVVANREMGHGIRPVYHQYQSAKAAVSAYLAAALPEATTVEEVARLWRQVSEAIDHEHLDPREFVDLGGLKFLLGQILDSFRPEVKP